MLPVLRSANYHDPVYREIIYRSPVGSGLFFAPEAVKRINSTVEDVLTSSLTHRLHFVCEDPCLQLGFPAIKYDAFGQLIGTLYLSDLSRSKIFVHGTMFYQWLLDENLLEEYMMAILLSRLVRMPNDKILQTVKPFDRIKTSQVVNDIIKEEGLFKEAWDKTFQRDATGGILKKLGDSLDTEIVLEVLSGGEESSFKINVLNSLVCGALQLSRLDRVFRLSFYSGKEIYQLDIDALLRDIDITENNRTITFSESKISDRQKYLFCSTFYNVIQKEVILENSVSFYRAFFRRGVKRYVKKLIENGITEEKITADTAFLTDLQLWHELYKYDPEDLEAVRHMRPHREPPFRVEADFGSRIEEIEDILLTIIKNNCGLSEEQMVVDVVAPNDTDMVWLSPSKFTGVVDSVSEARLTKIQDRRGKVTFSFFALNAENQKKLFGIRVGDLPDGFKIVSNCISS